MASFLAGFAVGVLFICSALAIVVLVALVLARNTATEWLRGWG